MHQHITLAYFCALPEGKLGYKTAAFIRNPYDRAYSGFLQIQRDFANQPLCNFQDEWIGSLVRAQIAANMERVINAGFDFDRWIELLPDYEVLNAHSNTNMPLHPAHYWTHVGGKQKVDFVGKVETFELDLQKFCDFVGIRCPEITNANFSNEVELVSGSFRYTERMSRRSLDHLNELFAKDFEYFQYEML